MAGFQLCSMADPNDIYEGGNDDFTNGYSSVDEYNNAHGIATASDIASQASNPNNLEYWLKKTQALAHEGDAGAIERLFNYYATKDSEKTALEWTSQREDTAYQRLVEDLRKAGISPYVLSSAGPAVSSYGGKSYSGSTITSSLNNARSNNTDVATSVLTGLFKVLGTALMFALMAAA